MSSCEFIFGYYKEFNLDINIWNLIYCFKAKQYIFLCL